MLRTFTCLTALSLTLMATPTRADVIDYMEAFDNATVQKTGPRSENNGKRFFNIEGNDFGDFASFGVADFAFDAPATPVASVDTIMIRLTQALAGFSTAGSVNFWITEDTDTGIQPGDSISFDDSALPDGVGTQLETKYLLGSGSFNPTASADQDEFSFTPSIELSTYLTERLNGEETIRLIVSPGDNGVAATYAGFSHAVYTGPEMGFSVSPVPEPSTLVLLLLGSIAAAGTGRRLRKR